MIRCLASLLVTSVCIAQSIEGPTFEVASLKRIGERSPTLKLLGGGPGSATPGRVSMIAPLGGIVYAAFEIPTSRLIVEASGVKLNEFYEFEAILPAGATKADLPAMYRNLLIERFHMRFHTERREVKQYELAVAPGGHKLKESMGEPPPLLPGGTVGTPGPDGYPVLPPGLSASGIGFRGKYVLQRPNVTLDEFARDVESHMRDGTVLNRTGLSGKYDIVLRWANPIPAGSPLAAQTTGDADAFPDPPFLPSLRAQLGLIVRESKGPGEVTIIDSFDAQAAPN